jgi:hypothetical protein
MSSFFERRYQNHLLAAQRLYGKGRSRVLWQHGILYFGGSLFLLYNAVAYLLDPRPPLGWKDWVWIALWLMFCLVAGYLRGVIMWRNFQRVFGNHPNVG